MTRQITASRHPVRWIRREVRAWVADRIAARDGVRPEIDNTDIALIDLREVCRLTGLGRSTIYELIGAGAFPAQVRIDLDQLRGEAA